MDYSPITSQMTWSYSRITSFESCPYKFLITYIYPSEKVPMFYSDFGSFMHRLLADYLCRKKTQSDLIAEYCTEFANEVKGTPPSEKIRTSFFLDGLNCLKHLGDIPNGELLVESKNDFEVEDLPFTGVLDLVISDDDKLVLVDHKSHNLKERSKRSKPTLSDKELDEYLRQLYLYSRVVFDRYGRFPDLLAFDCYRSGAVIKEEFHYQKYLETSLWASNLVSKIVSETDWYPNPDYYYCSYLCDVHDNCEYYQMNYKKG